MASACFHFHMGINVLQRFTHRRCFTIKPSSSVAIKWSSNTSGRCTTKSLILCQAASINEVEVVTACSWIELVVAADMPALVILWAPNCGLSQMICQIVDELAKEYAGKTICYKLNIEEYPNVATQYGIESFPAMLLFKHGENKETIIGVLPKSDLCSTLDKYVD